MKNILVISPRYPPEEKFPRGTFVKAQVDELKKYFDRVVVISTTPYLPRFLSRFMSKKRIQESLMKDYTYDNVEVYYTKDFILPFSFHKKMWGAISFKNITNILDVADFKPEIIHAHFLWPSGYAAMKLKERLRIPFVVSVHGYDAYDLPFRDDFYMHTIKTILSKSDHIISINSFLKDLITEEIGDFREKISIIPNGFNDNLFRKMKKIDARKILGLQEDKKILLSVGNSQYLKVGNRIVNVKGHEYLVDAAHRILAQKEDVEFIVLGNSDISSEEILFLGQKPYDEIPLWINACDIFVLPSLYEGTPTVMFEALACGKPFVGTCVGGVSDIIKNEKLGFLVPAGNSKALANAIIRALETEWDTEYITNYAKQFSSKNIAKKVIEVYSKIGKINL